MRTLFFASLVYFFSLTVGAESSAGLADAQLINQKLIRVRLEKKMDSISLQGFAIRILNKKDNTLLYSNSRLSQLKIMAVKNKSSLSLRIKVGEQEKSLQANSELIVQGTDLRAGLQELPQKVSILKNANQIDLIGHYEIENYLVGVLAGEVPLSWPEEALKTQAIAARTYAMAVLQERKTKAYDVENSIMDQMFKSIDRRQEKSKSILRAKKAVLETEGVVLVDDKNKIKKIYYHADCGGQTISEKKVWGTGSVAQAQSCPGNHDSGWSFAISKDEANQKLKNRLGDDIEFDQIKPIKPSENERAERINFYLNKTKVASLGANFFREALGFSKLKSTQFEVVNQENEFRFRGRGWGHGVGLCQLGAKAMAQAGSRAEKILSFYYPDRHLSQGPGVISAIE